MGVNGVGGNGSAPRSILITGCSSGIGYDAAHTLKDLGWRVFATCRKDIPTDAIRALFEANFFGWHDLTRRVLPTMRKQGHGRIIQCSSVLGLVALKFRGPYNASKFALEGLSDTLRLELDGTGIHVVLIEPGPITTKIRENSRPHFYRWIDWENSVWRTVYEKQLIPRLETTEKLTGKFELEPAAVTAKLIRALESPRPRPRYYVTTPTYIAGLFKRGLTSRALDGFLDRWSR